MKRLLLILVVIAAFACGRKDSEKAPEVAKRADSGREMVTDPASQILMLEAAIDKKTTELSGLPVDATKQREKLELEIDILKKNLKRVRAKPEMRD